MEVEWEWEVAGPLHVDTMAVGWVRVAGVLDKEAGEGPQAVVMVVVMAVVMAAGDPEDLVEAEDDDAKVKNDNRESWSRFSKMSSFHRS